MKLLQLCVTISFFSFTFYLVKCHSHEPPHLKYTREVNEAALNGDDYAADHHHSHGGCSHGHGHHEDNHQHSHSHSHNSNGHKTDKSLPPMVELFDKNSQLAFLNDAKIRLWVYSIGSTLLISIFPCFILAFIPIQANSGENSPLLKLLLAFGAGGLLGDAFLHLIPHATPPSAAGSHTHSHGGSHDHSHEPHDMSVGQWVVTGFMVFFIVEKFVRILRGDDDPHGHSHAPSQKTHKIKHSDDEDEKEKDEGGKKRSQSRTVDDLKRVPRIRVAAYLNLVADFMHNFTDGLAIGASFVAGSTVGIVTMITVLVHEIPHEVGDFAILVQSGYSKKKAMCIQLCTALGAMAGCVVSLWSVDAYALAEAAEQSWVLPFTAGGFIYIATVSVIPELLERSTLWQSVCETTAIVFGVFLMYLIAFYE